MTLFHNTFEKKLQPLIKWAGGKEKELKHILPLIPTSFEKYFEPFVGGGAVYFAIEAQKYYINDKSDELINLYLAIKMQDEEFFQAIYILNHKWKKLAEIIYQYQNSLINLYKSFRNNTTDIKKIEKNIYHIFQKNKEIKDIFTFFQLYEIDTLEHIVHTMVQKFIRTKKIEQKKGLLSEKDIIDNIESAIRAAFYTKIRSIYNSYKAILPPSKYTALFFFIRNYAYSGMFRYNAKGDFNVPYGGIGYNKKNLDKKILYFKSNLLYEKLQQTEISNLDFEDFLNRFKPTKDDFIFLDPPYDSEFSTYAQNKFTKDDQKRLAHYLIHHCKAKWMLVIKYTEFIYNLYASHNHLFIQSFNKKYLVSFKNRNNKDAQHLIITNYSQK